MKVLLFLATKNDLFLGECKVSITITKKRIMKKILAVPVFYTERFIFDFSETIC